MTRASNVLASLAATAALVALASPARAQPGASEPPPSTVVVKAPAGWALDGALTARQAKTLRASKHPGGDFRAAAAFHRSPEPGGAFIVSELVAEPAPADPVAAARAELAAVKSVVAATGGTLVTWEFRGGEPTLPEARLEWKDPSVGTTSITRALAFRSAGSLVIVTGECVLAGDAEAALRAPCEAALAALAPVGSLARLDVGLGATDPATATAIDQPDTVDDDGGATDAAGSGSGGAAAAGGRAAPSMRAGGPDLPVTVYVKPPASKPDRRPLMLIGGVMVLALVFLWNRRQRARLEAAEARERQRADSRSARRAATPADAERDAAREPGDGEPEPAADAPSSAVEPAGDDAPAAADDEAHTGSPPGKKGDA
jgi:hypothetical protein